MEFDSVYFLLVALGFAIAGAVEIFPNRCFFVSRKKYTEESIRAFAKHDGCVEIAIGVSVFVLRFGAMGRKACLVILIGALTYYSIQMSKILVKK